MNTKLITLGVSLIAGFVIGEISRRTFSDKAKTIKWIRQNAQDELGKLALRRGDYSKEEYDRYAVDIKRRRDAAIKAL